MEKLLGEEFDLKVNERTTKTMRISRNECRDSLSRPKALIPVSYTHLFLPLDNKRGTNFAEL